ncbi:MAG: hypothetical protein CM1200mP15_03980 [Dehalococcoidia bacterium]|nr:MAG: hypothetical protein CM1200mP15_03980 [Dehalococcoidia bacterium]
MIRRMIGSALLRANVFGERLSMITQLLCRQPSCYHCLDQSRFGKLLYFRGENFIIAVAAGIIFGLGKGGLFGHL